MKRYVSILHGYSSPHTRVVIGRQINETYVSNEYTPTDASLWRTRRTFFPPFNLDPTTTIAVGDIVLEVRVSVPKEC